MLTPSMALHHIGHLLFGDTRRAWSSAAEEAVLLPGRSGQQEAARAGACGTLC